MLVSTGEVTASEEWFSSGESDTASLDSILTEMAERRGGSLMADEAIRTRLSPAMIRSVSMPDDLLEGRGGNGEGGVSDATLTQRRLFGFSIVQASSRYRRSEICHFSVSPATLDGQPFPIQRPTFFASGGRRAWRLAIKLPCNLKSRSTNEDAKAGTPWKLDGWLTGTG